MWTNLFQKILYIRNTENMDADDCYFFNRLTFKLRKNTLWHYWKDASKLKNTNF